MVKAISLNGVKGTVTVDKDGSGTVTLAGLGSVVAAGLAFVLGKKRQAD